MMVSKRLAYIVLVGTVTLLTVGCGDTSVTPTPTPTPTATPTPTPTPTPSPVITAMPAATPGKISIEAAMEAVRQFEGCELPDLRVSALCDPEVDSDIELESGKTIYDVDSYTGNVLSALYLGNLPGNATATILDKDALVIAERFAQQHYEAFSALTLISSKVIGQGSGNQYLFLWSEIVNGAITPNKVQVRINASTGAIISYGGRHQAIDPFNSPSISKTEAKAIAEQSLRDYWEGRGHTLRGVDIDEPILEILFFDDVQHLTWKVELCEPEDPDSMLPDIMRGAQYVIDAYNGDILSQDFTV